MSARLGIPKQCCICRPFPGQVRNSHWRSSPAGLTLHNCHALHSVQIQYANNRMRRCRYTSKTDVWSYGILLHEIFTDGEKPYKDMTNAVMIALVRYFFARLLFAGTDVSIQRAIDLPLQLACCAWLTLQLCSNYDPQVSQGYRLPRVSDCPPLVYAYMLRCWDQDPVARPTFKDIVQFLQLQAPRHDSVGAGATRRLSTLIPVDPNQYVESAKVLAAATTATVYDLVEESEPSAGMNTLGPQGPRNPAVYEREYDLLEEEYNGGPVYEEANNPTGPGYLSVYPSDELAGTQDESSAMGMRELPKVSLVADLSQYAWYRPELTRQTAEQLLRMHDKEGAFVVRLQSGCSHIKIISVLLPALTSGLRVNHIQISVSSKAMQHRSSTRLFWL